RRMDLIEPAVQAHLIVDVRCALPIVSERPGSSRDGLVRSEHRASVAESAKVLRRVEAQGRHLADRTYATSTGSGSDCLRAVLDDAEGELRAQGFEAIESDAVSVEVHGQEESNPAVTREKASATLEVQQAGWVRIHEHGDATATHHGERRREGAERRGEDLVAWADP